jgi:hypothetical protein
VNMNNRSVVNAKQNSMNPARRLIGFRVATVKPRSIARLGGVAALAILSLVALPSPSHGQEHQEKQEHSQHQTRGRQNTSGRRYSNEERDRGHGEGRGRITEARFGERFGGEHRFRINEETFNAGFFGYGGFEFGFLEPWPAGWAYDSDVYVDYVDDGYVLVNPMYPGVTLGLTLR